MSKFVKVLNISDSSRDGYARNHAKNNLREVNGEIFHVNAGEWEVWNRKTYEFRFMSAEDFNEYFVIEKNIPATATVAIERANALPSWAEFCKE